MTQAREQTSIHSRQKWLRWLNLRPEESGRTFLMFAFYTLSSVGILWLEVSVAALFLGEFGAESLPWIYMASAVIGTSLGSLYSWLQRFIPLRRVIVIMAVLTSLPLILFQMGLSSALLAGAMVFVSRLWLEAIYVVNELNTSITANQLFNIREVKRTYPLISSGILAADVISGFSLPGLRGLIGLPNVILLACSMLLIGAGILFYLTIAYSQAFPDSARRRKQDRRQDITTQRLRGRLREYVTLVIVFFAMVQVLAALLDFQYLGQLQQLDVQVDKIADFLALFSAVLGIFELIGQWFILGRAIERFGVFGVTWLPPVATILIGASTLLSISILAVGQPLFIGILSLKFMDELLRYTVVASVSPVLFQPIPRIKRSRVQSMVRGIVEPLSTGLTGFGVLALLWCCRHIPGLKALDTAQSQSFVFLLSTVLCALLWLGAVWLLRSKYLEVLVLSAEQGVLGSISSLNVKALKRNIVDVLNRSRTDSEKSSCITLLTQIDPKNVGGVLSPLMPTFSPALQHQSLQAMLHSPNPAYLHQVWGLIGDTPSLHPEVLATALRYIWAVDPESDLNQLKLYVSLDVDPVVRGTGAALLLKQGNSGQKAEATAILRRMLTHKQERERVMGCRALGDAAYLQSLRLYIEPLLLDESLRVRCAMLEAISATHLEEYYPSLLKGLQYKSTREAARRSLVRLENEAIPLLVALAEDFYQSETLRIEAWKTIGQISTREAIDVLVRHLHTAWGATRRSLLRILLRMPDESGIEAVSETLGRHGIETMMEQELQFLAHLCASRVDLLAIAGEEMALLCRALHHVETDSIERLFLLMRFLYDSTTIQAAIFNLQSDSRDNLARGLEILDNTLDIPKKVGLLNVLELYFSNQVSSNEQMQRLDAFLAYEPMSPNQRLRNLVDLRHFLSEWALACCFHVARVERWSLTAEQTLASLRNPTGLVREAVLAYLKVASPRVLSDLAPSLKDDPDPLVAAQIRAIMAELGSGSSDSSTTQGLVILAKPG